MSTVSPASATSDKPYFRQYEHIYQRALDNVRLTISTWPPLLQARAKRFLAQLAQADFTRVAALWPIWVAQVVDTPADIALDLASANIWGWAYYRIQDWIIDSENQASDDLIGGTVFFVQYLRQMQAAMPHDSLFWNAFRDLTIIAAEANEREITRRFADWSDLGAGTLKSDPLDALAERSAPLQLCAIAQLRRQGHFPSEPVYHDLLRIIQAYAIVNQLVDDEEDLGQDLAAGRLNYISTMTIQRMLETKAIRSCAELDADRAMGYYVTDDTLLAEVHEIRQHYLSLAISLAQTWQARDLASFFGDMASALETEYLQRSKQRQAFRELFGIRT